MAHNMEPMEIDTIENVLEDKENYHHGNFVSKTPCTEKGYEELDVSELNMKLRYSITPVSSPMSKSVTLNCVESKNYDRGDNSFFNSSGPCNMSKSLNSTVTVNDTLKCFKTLPLQPLTSDHFADGVKQLARPLDTQLIQCVDVDNTVSQATIGDETFSLPSSSSSMAHTPEATTPTKEISKQDGGSPILRGLKSVLSMFRTSQSPVKNEKVQNDDLTTASTSTSCIVEDQQILASTPITTHTVHSKVSPFRESIVFKDDLEKELQWKDDTTIIFSQERVPAHKLFPDIQLKASTKASIIDKEEKKVQENLDSTTMSMDISLYYNDCSVGDVTIAENNTIANTSTVESDNEFVDCETTFKEESIVEKNTDDQNADLTKNIDVVKEITSESTDVVNESTSKLLNITESVLSTSRVDEENKTQLYFNNDDNICNPDCEDIPLKVSHDAEEPNRVKVITKAENHNDTTLKDLNISNKSVHSDRSQAEALKPDTNVKSEHDVSQANITLSSEENTSVKQSTKKYNIDDQLIKNGVINIKDAYSQYETDLVKQEHVEIVPGLDNNAGNYGAKEFETKETAELELMNYDMSMTSETFAYENDTTINVISNIDTFFRDNDNNIATKAKNILPEILSNLPVNVPLPNSDDFVLLNDPISTIKPLSTTQDKIVAADITDRQSEIKINKVPISLSIIGSSLEEVKELNVNSIIDTKDVRIDCIFDNLDEITKLSIEDKTISDIKDQSFHDIQENYENQNLCNIQVDPSENTCCKDKLLSNNKTDTHARQENDLEITMNAKGDTVFNSETIDKLTITSEEEIIVSENNSPYISLSANKVTVENTVAENLDEIVNPFTTKSKITSSPPISPKIQSKGYNFNFDEIDDPFTTKTKIRLSPPLDDVHTTINIEEKNESKTKPTNKVKSPPKKPKTNTPRIKKVPNYDLKENFSTVKAQCNEVYESKTDTIPTKVIFTAKNFDSLSSSTFDITNDLDENKSKEDLFHGQNSETFSSTTFNITTDKSSEIETQYLQENLDSTIVLSTNTHSQAIETPSIDDSCPNLIKENKSAFDESNYFCAEPSHNRNATIVNTTVTEIGDTLEYNKEECFDLTTNLDTFSCTTFNITTDVITMDQTDLQVENESTTVLKDTTSQETAGTFNIDTIVDKPGDKIILSDQSANSSGTASSTSSSKNVFNIPEINETFTSSTAAANMQQTITQITSNTDNVLDDNIINMITLNNEDNAEDLNCTTSSKITDDKNNTIREINTEDEDTIEGPFLESDDLNIIEKGQDSCDQKQDMMQFMDLNHAGIDENPEGGEIFIDAKAFEFLLNQNMTNVVSDCGKESLFLKFDPLFAKRVSSVGAAASSPKKVQSIPNKPSKTTEQLPIAGPSSQSMDTLYSNDPFQDKIIESTNSTNKPTMVVTPAFNSVVPKNQTPCAPRSNRHSFTLTSPAIAVIDRLLSISGNNSLLGQDTTMVHNEQQETEQNFSTQLRELLAEKELQFHTMKSESSKLRDRLSVLESHVDKLEKEGQKRLNNINALSKELADKTKENRNMAAVVEEYERTIASLIAERVQEKKQRDEERKQLIQERDEQIAHLSNMECSFNDLHSKYEKSKQTIIGFKVNEDAYKKTLKDFEENLAKMQNNYELLKQHATSKLNHANQELEKMNKMHAADILKLKAMIKRKELEITSLEESLTQKTKANDELTAICDELINKVG